MGIKLLRMAKAAEWLSRVEAWRTSGMSSRQFCEGKGYSSQSLLYWSSRLSRESTSLDDKEAPAVRLAPVRMRRDSGVKSTGSVVVHVGQARVEVGAGAERTLLALVMGALMDAQGQGGGQ